MCLYKIKPADIFIFNPKVLYRNIPTELLTHNEMLFKNDVKKRLQIPFSRDVNTVKLKTYNSIAPMS